MCPDQKHFQQRLPFSVTTPASNSECLHQLLLATPCQNICQPENHML
ncbi:hypothetical protein Nmel_006471 [Mimus melanotis]